MYLSIVPVRLRVGASTPAAGFTPAVDKNLLGDPRGGMLCRATGTIADEEEGILSDVGGTLLLSALAMSVFGIHPWAAFSRWKNKCGTLHGARSIRRDYRRGLHACLVTELHLGRRKQFAGRVEGSGPVLSLMDWNRNMLSKVRPPHLLLNAGAEQASANLPSFLFGV